MPKGSMPQQKPNLIIFTDLLLAPSMTFVRSQAEALDRFAPYYVGSRAVASGGLDLPVDRTVIINRTGSRCGKLREVPFKLFSFDPVFFRRVRRLHPVLVHAHFAPAAVVALPLVEYLDVPMVVTFHGYDATVRREFGSEFHYTFRVYWRKRERLKRRAARFIAVSEFIRTQLIRRGYPEDKIQVHYIGVDTDFFTPARTVPRERIVLFVGRLTEKKGCEYLIRAMQEVQCSYPDWGLTVIGEGELRSDLERFAREKVRNCVFLGVQTAAAIRDWMQRASIFCVPSVVAANGDAEGFGLVFAEAQATGMPVVSFDSGGVPEAVAHEETGFLAPEKDWRTLARYLGLLVNRPELQHQMGEAGRKRVRRKFDLITQTKTLEGIYEDVISSMTPGERLHAAEYVTSTTT